MEEPLQLLLAAIVSAMCVIMMGKLLLYWWVLPHLTYQKLKAKGFSGPKPSFPFGNLNDIKRMKMNLAPSSLSVFTNDIHSTAFPYFSLWQKLYGKVMVYWLGTEPFVYIAEAEFVKEMRGEIKGKEWGKPDVFKQDREAMFGSGLFMVEGEDWVRRRHVIAPAFSPTNLKAMGSLMVELATGMLDRWACLIAAGQAEINVEAEIMKTAGAIIAKTSFGISDVKGRKVLQKLREMQITLFNSNRYVGVPFGKFLNPKTTLKTTALGKEIDERRRNASRNDLLGRLMAENGVFTTKELVDECKTFFFGGHETTALLLTWTLFLLAVNPQWQEELAEEIQRVVPGGEIADGAALAGLEKMGWVMNEVLRLYPPAPNIQRQCRREIRMGEVVIPKGTNLWIDVVSMHHDERFWGEDVHDFKPQRFKDNIKSKMGFFPFGFGGRMCVGRNFSVMEYKIVLTLILSRFSFSVSPNYRHHPCHMLSLRPMHGMPLIVKPL